MSIKKACVNVRFQRSLHFNSGKRHKLEEGDNLNMLYAILKILAFFSRKSGQSVP